MTLLEQFQSDIKKLKEGNQRGLDILSGKVTEEKDWIEKELLKQNSKQKVD